ncbi:MAG: hypothetical protein ACREI9_07690 [Nitrospiraceae bacterium]
MARQVDYVSVTLLIERLPDGSYVKSISSARTAVSDPLPVSGKEIDRGTLVGESLPGLAYDGASTLDAFMDLALKQAYAEASVMDPLPKIDPKPVP